MDTYPKDGCRTKEALTSDNKQVKEVYTERSQPADINKAPPSRIYTRDYGKVQDQGDTDTVGPFLGNPLRW